MAAQIGILIIGWLLGLLSAPIADAIRKRRLRRELRPAIIAELKELQYTLTLVAGSLPFNGERDEAAYDLWAWPIISQYDGPARNEVFLQAYEARRKLPHGALEAHLRSGAAPTNAKRVVTYELPFLNSHLASLSIYPLEFQRRILDIRYQLSGYNDKAACLMADLRMTFDASIHGMNRQSLQQNIDGGYRDLGSRAEGLAKSIALVT